MEILVLRRQVQELQKRPSRPRLGRTFRIYLVLLSRMWPRWKEACILVKPTTVIGWHRLGFRVFWRWKSRRTSNGRSARSRLITQTRRMVAENPTWGAPRIHGELIKLGLRVSERTVSRFIPKRSYKGDDLPKRRQNWKTFLENHREVIAAMDFCVVPTWNFRQLYILVILQHGRRMIAHVNVTANPTAEWVKQQLREAFPYGESPRYLIFDNDTTFGAVKSFVESMGISPKQTAFHCPWQNGAVERFNGILRRELLDHIVALDEAHLLRLVKDFLSYYHEDRTHLALGKDAPKGRQKEIPPNPSSTIEVLPRVGGLHHRYTWRDAA